MIKEQTSVSEHYLGDAGQKYVAHRQTDPESEGYAIDFDYFGPYLKAGDTALDFGCGNGGILRHLARNVTEAHGLEINPAAAQIARSTGLTVYEDLEELPPVPVYDAIISNHVLEHVRDVASTLEQLAKSLKPGGLLLLKLPIDDWRAGRQQSWSRGDIDHHLQTWTPRLIANVLYEAGYEVDDVRIITSAWHPKFFWFKKIGLSKLVSTLLAMALKRRQLFVVGRLVG